MDIRIRGAREHNLQNVDVAFGDGLTVVTGVSGSGKTSLVFDTLTHEAQRRFLDVYLYGRGGQRLAPAAVEQISGLGPTVAVGQNLLNRNPNSTLASAAGLSPFLRLLFANYGARRCLHCDEAVTILSADEIVARLQGLARREPIQLTVPLVHRVRGSHRTLLAALAAEFGGQQLIVDARPWESSPLKPDRAHTIEISLGTVQDGQPLTDLRALVDQAAALGAGAVRVRGATSSAALATTLRCAHCGHGLGELRATHFNQQCPYCQGAGCRRCAQTGMHPQAASVHWQERRLPELLQLSVDEAANLFSTAAWPATAERLKSELTRRLAALARVGLGYVALNRPAPTLSRGEAQRVRLAIALTSPLEDMVHVLDEPTVGQHPADIARFLPAFRALPGPVICVEHERQVAAAADRVIDLGPGAGSAGGRVVFAGPPTQLWQHPGATGRYFSLRERVQTPTPRPPAASFLHIHGAQAHNLRNVDVQIPLQRLTVVTGVSGSGKSTLIEHVLLPSLQQKKASGCRAIDGPAIKAVMVDQAPIGRNPRSNPATYTRLADAIRDLFAAATGRSKSHFSFNRPEGACPECAGTGATEIKMRYLPSIWLPCPACDGLRFNADVLAARVDFGAEALSVADVYGRPIGEIGALIAHNPWLTPARRRSAARILRALNEIGLGYLQLGQPSPTLSGGEAQRVKLSKHLGRSTLARQLLLLDEPSTGLHPQDLDGLLRILDRLVRQGATIVIVEHNGDIIRAADWIIDLGPGAGPAGGQLLYQGPPAGLRDVAQSLTGQALRGEAALQPQPPTEPAPQSAPVIAIRNACANNLKGVDVEIPKGKLTVVTGVSGSGKSSLVGNVLAAEARRRYLESLSLYERQGLREGAAAPVDAVSGLGVTLTIAGQRAHTWSQLPQFTRRNTVGAITEIDIHLAHLLAAYGDRTCLSCGTSMRRGEEWSCLSCGATAPLAQPRHFSSAHWSSACKACNGLGATQLPQPEKLIVQPDKPLCAGAMYSPGYWPQSYLCKDQPIIAEIGKQYGFDPLRTPWNEMSAAAQNAFLYGDGREYSWTYVSKGGRSKGQEKRSTWTWHGFYGEGSWVFSGDLHGTYTRQETCPGCGGAGLRPEVLAVTLHGRNVHQLSELPLLDLAALAGDFRLPPAARSPQRTSLRVLRKRLRFLGQVGLGYLHLNRPSGTLSAGEAQRIQLASLLGSELTALTILLDEPSRGLHPSELAALRDALGELRDAGNTVIVVEHDPLLILAADQIIDVGPGAGAAGGEIVAQGPPAEIMAAATTTGRWLRDSRLPLHGDRRQPSQWLTVRGARANNLRGVDVSFPLGAFCGICGVSGSGKSTLLIDTIGRALVKKQHATSFAHEPIEPGAHDSIENAPRRAFLVDQVRQGISSPAAFLGFEKPLLKLFAASDAAQSLGLTAQTLGARCTACGGKGVVRIKMGFLPDEWEECEICRGTGCRPEAWEVAIDGVSLPEINGMTIDEIYHHFAAEAAFARRLDVVRQVGLGYLVWKQAAYTLSGGEAQRLKIAKELLKRTRVKTLYILDEPTVGLHLQDVARLVAVLNQLVDAGHTVLAVEHHAHFLAACDWLVELGPAGGPAGGRIIAAGPPEAVAQLETPTAPYLADVLAPRSQQ